MLLDIFKTRPCIKSGDDVDDATSELFSGTDDLKGNCVSLISS